MRQRWFLLRYIVLFSILIITTSLIADPTFTVNASQEICPISPTMYGVFIEDINFAADGGLYAELVKNRSFEFDRPLRGWRRLQKRDLDNRVLFLRNDENPRNPRFAQILINNPEAEYGLQNEGFRGMGIQEDAVYRFSMMAQQVDGKISIRVELVDSKNQVLGSCKLDDFNDDWKVYEVEMTSSNTDSKSKLNIYFVGKGRLNIDMVSLFPKDTWKGRKNGLRKDIVQLLADMKPGFLRFPGGCIVEGFDLSQRYQWKHTVGDLAERVWNINRWNFEFRHRYTPDYYQSYGLGFYEYFLLAEDLNAEPMPIINCGMACQFNTAELVPMDEMDPYVQDALDLIEFANGSIDSEWGRLRAKMGHPNPFKMKMIGIGNEQWGPQYIERYKVIAKAIKDKYPDMKLIAATGSDGSIFPNGENEIDYLWKQWRELKPEIVDEHYYRLADWFLENTRLYDDYERTGQEIFVGEYASQSVGVASPKNRNIWKTALYEAAFMTGMERNADLVTMSCYAPLLAHEEAWQWRPDMIWFDNLKAYGSVNYHVQKLFSLYPGTHLLEAELSDVPDLNEKVKALHGSATLNKEAGEVIVKLVNVSEKPIETKILVQGVKEIKSKTEVILLKSDDLNEENSLEEPMKIIPVISTMKVNRPEFHYTTEPFSLTILKIPVKYVN